MIYNWVFTFVVYAFLIVQNRILFNSFWRHVSSFSSSNTQHYIEFYPIISRFKERGCTLHSSEGLIEHVDDKGSILIEYNTFYNWYGKCLETS
jgi:hypothetical protein